MKYSSVMWGVQGPYTNKHWSVNWFMTFSPKYSSVQDTVFIITNFIYLCLWPFQHIFICARHSVHNYKFYLFVFMAISTHIHLCKCSLLWRKENTYLLMCLWPLHKNIHLCKCSWLHNKNNVYVKMFYDLFHKKYSSVQVFMVTKRTLICKYFNSHSSQMSW
jgi:hypothetical protein